MQLSRCPLKVGSDRVSATVVRTISYTPKYSGNFSNLKQFSYSTQAGDLSLISLLPHHFSRGQLCSIHLSLTQLGISWVSASLWWQLRIMMVVTTLEATMNMMQLKYVPEVTKIRNQSINNSKYFMLAIMQFGEPKTLATDVICIFTYVLLQAIRKNIFWIEYMIILIIKKI